MKIAFITMHNPFDIHNSSGTPYHMLRALSNCGFQIRSIYSVNSSNDGKSNSITARLRRAYREGTLISKIKYRFKELYYGKLRSEIYFRIYDPSYIRYHATRIEEELSKADCDIVFVLSNVIAAYLNIDKPLVFWYDSTFSGIIDIYPPFDRLCNETRNYGHKVDELALSKCRLAIFSSEWAANSAINDYGADPKKVKVVPFGANLNCSRTNEDIHKIIQSKSKDSCKLFFMGTNWFGKGGDTAIEVAKKMNQRGLKTELHIAGCIPPKDVPQFVVSHGFISKKTDKGRNLLEKLYSEAHFFILPSRYESFGIVFAEASSFGLPSLATRVGGIPSAVRGGINGQTFLLDDETDNYCDYIMSLMSDREKYELLSLSAFDEYLTRLNWSTSIQKVHDHILKACY